MKLISKGLATACIVLITCNALSAQKCDTLTVNGKISQFGCPQRALGTWKSISRKIDDGLWHSLEKHPINFCDECNYTDNTHNKFTVHNPALNDELFVEPTHVPIGDERRRTLFLGHDVRFVYALSYGNIPERVYRSGEIINARIDSLNQVYGERINASYNKMVEGKKLNAEELKVQKEFYTAMLVIPLEEQLGSPGFTLKYEFNRDVFAPFDEPGKNYLELSVIKRGVLKEIPFKIPAITIPYVAIDYLKDNSPFSNINEEYKDRYDFSKKLPITDPRDKEFITILFIGKKMTSTETNKMANSQDYSVYNMLFTITGKSFEKNHEVLNVFDWNELSSIINNKKP